MITREPMSVDMQLIARDNLLRLAATACHDAAIVSYGDDHITAAKQLAQQHFREYPIVTTMTAKEVATATARILRISADMIEQCASAGVFGDE